MSLVEFSVNNNDDEGEEGEEEEEGMAGEPRAGPTKNDHETKGRKSAKSAKRYVRGSKRKLKGRGEIKSSSNKTKQNETKTTCKRKI